MQKAEFKKQLLEISLIHKKGIIFAIEIWNFRFGISKKGVDWF
jgi:hypothetical protein